MGVTRIAKSLPAKSSFTARPKYDPASDRLVGMRYSPLAANAEAQFVEYDDSWQVATRLQLSKVLYLVPLYCKYTRALTV